MDVRPARGGPRRSAGRATASVVALVVCAAWVGWSASVVAQGSSPGALPGPSVVPSVAASDASPAAPADDALTAGLLQAADMPGALKPVTAVLEGTDYDIDEAAFEANDGVRIVSRTWGRDAPAGTSLVFDIRMQFPTPEAASAYLAAALPILSESTTTGLQPLASPAPPAIGEETRVFGLDTQGSSGAAVSIRTYLFRVGSVVAKVLAGGPDLGPAEAETLARAAAGRMTAAGPPAPGSPRPRSSPAAGSGPPPSLPSGDLVSLLLAHIPEPIASTCTPDQQRLWEGELVTLVCAPTDADVEVTYSGFDTADHMGAAYQSSLDAIDLSDMAASCDLGTYTGAYQVDGEDAGQVTCWSEANGRAIMWSDDRLQTLSVAVSPSLDSAGLYLWWLDAGPTP